MSETVPEREKTIERELVNSIDVEFVEDDVGDHDDERLVDELCDNEPVGVSGGVIVGLND